MNNSIACAYCPSPVAALSFRSLSSVLDSEAHVRAEARRWSEVGLLLAQMTEDVSSVSDVGSFALGASAQADLVLTRFGDAPGAPPRRVGYRLRQGRVEYLLWSRAQDAASPPAAVYPVLERVAAMQLSALREDGSWGPAWTPGALLPRAVAVELVLASGERVTRLFTLR